MTAKLFHADLWGLRDSKYDWLNGHDIQSTDWRELTPKPEMYLFVTRDDALLEMYQTFLKITDIFTVYSVGIVTARDRLTIHWTPEDVWTTVVTFSRMKPELAREAYKLGKDVQDWKVELAQKDILDSGPDRNKIVPILYRPFDIRYTYYTGNSRGFICRPRPEVMRNMLQDNIAIITSRLTKGEKFKHIQVTKNISEVIVMSPKTSNNGFVFPLYLYPHKDKKDLFDKIESTDKKNNIHPDVFKLLTTRYSEKPTPERIFYYIYAILYSTLYRDRYAEFLKTDFPRVPFTKDYALFTNIAALGERLVGLHLMTSPDLDYPIAKFQGEGNGKVEKVKYEERNKQVYINGTQYFENVPDNIWTYQIGGYQVCAKWLKDRKRRTLSLDEIQHYCKIVTALQKTIELQGAIDELYPDVEKTVIVRTL